MFLWWAWSHIIYFVARMERSEMRGRCPRITLRFIRATDYVLFFPSSSHPNFSFALRVTSGLGALLGGNLSRQCQGLQALMTATEWVMSPTARFSGDSRASAGESHAFWMNWIDSLGSVRVSIAHSR